MHHFLTDHFLLSNDFAQRLYHGHAASLPIIDYHCHLSPKDIATNRQFANLTQAWLEGDHYKWRAMRTLGIQEQFITGKADDFAKFQKWAYTVPYTMRNPLYHWTHLELWRYFQIEQLLNADSAATVYQTANEQLQAPGHTTQGLLRQHRVEVVCTTDDPTDSLEWHDSIRHQKLNMQVLPTFRPDKVLAIDNPDSFLMYIENLSAASGTAIQNFDSLLAALENRIDYFAARGCRLADHGLEHLYLIEEGIGAAEVFSKALLGKSISQTEANTYRHRVLLELCRLYHARGWTQQFHLGALRNVNTRMLKQLGPDTGFDTMGDFSQGRSLARFFNELDQTNQLAKTIVYNLNPSHNEVFATMVGNFNDGSVKGKMQFGSAWWFLDQKDGMEKQINALSNLGLLSCFVGMLTDSRSFLSFPRHEYFRRILCNLLGRDVANGELPADEQWLGKIVSDICYFNARHYFQFE